MNRIEALNILGLDADATLADIKAAYRECVQILHPDRFEGNKKLQNRATEQFKRLQDAYELLTSGRGKKGAGSAAQANGAHRAYSRAEAQLAGLEAARTQLVAQRDAVADERRNALLMIVGGGVLGLLLRRIPAIAALAGTILIWGIVSFIGAFRTLSTIDEHLAEIEQQRRDLEGDLEEEAEGAEEDS